MKPPAPARRGSTRRQTGAPAGQIGEAGHRGQGQGQPDPGAGRLVAWPPGDEHHPGGGEGGWDQEAADPEDHPEPVAHPVPHRAQSVGVQGERAEDPHGDEPDAPGVLDVALEHRQRRGEPRPDDGTGSWPGVGGGRRAAWEAASARGATFGFAPAPAGCRPGGGACAHRTALRRHHNGPNANSRPTTIRGSGPGTCDQGERGARSPASSLRR